MAFTREFPLSLVASAPILAATKHAEGDNSPQRIGWQHVFRLFSSSIAAYVLTVVGVRRRIKS